MLRLEHQTTVETGLQDATKFEMRPSLFTEKDDQDGDLLNNDKLDNSFNDQHLFKNSMVEQPPCALTLVEQE